MQSVAGVQANLTAVVDDELDRGLEQVQFALALLEEQKVNISSVAEMPGLAEVARRELLG
jgi:hypothetical protein